MNEVGERNQGSKKIANLAINVPEHETEYVLTVHNGPFGKAERPHPDWEREIQDRLGEGWSVMNRSGRIEIRPPSLAINEENTQRVRSALGDILGPRYNLRESEG